MKVGVIGAGTMGSGIAQAFAQTEGYEVYIVKDCCSSRNEFEENTGFELMKSEGAKLTCVEISLFEWLESSKHPQFKDIQKLIK